MPTRLWYLRVNGQPTGPFEPQHLRRLVADGRLAPDDRLRCTGDPKWHRARKIVGLFDRPASDTPSPARAADTRPEIVDPLAREFSDVAAILRHEHRERNRAGNAPRRNEAEVALRLAQSAAEAARPEPVCTVPVISAGVITALVTYLGIAFLAPRAMPHAATPPPAIHEPTVAEAAAAARNAIIARSDPKTAEVAKLELVRQTEMASETSPAWFTFRGQVCWTNRLGAPVEADFGVIVRYDPARSVYAPDLVTRDGRILSAEIEICGRPRHAELEQLVHELFER